MKANTMFSKGKSGAKLLENNAILHHFHVGRLFASGGPEGVWKIYEGYYKTDGKVSNECHVKYNHPLMYLLVIAHDFYF